ncbi:MAG TPA: ion channel, partial [Cryptosporangiaceae bacterium]|nr:ion channel [Cryptosporangiaceae bacterium]
LIRLTLAPDRSRFVRTHVPDLVVVVVPPLRALKVLFVLLRMVGLVRFLGRLSTQSLHVRTGTYTGLLAVGVLFIGAVSVLRVERDAPEANITSFQDALWWTITTMTTVGYGDRYPVTGQGRLVAGVLMISGIAILGVVTATIAAWFVGQFAATDAKVEFVADEVQQVGGAVHAVDDDVDRVGETTDRIDDRLRVVEAGEAADDAGRDEVLAAVRAIAARLDGLERAVQGLKASASADQTRPDDERDG